MTTNPTPGQGHGASDPSGTSLEASGDASEATTTVAQRLAAEALGTFVLVFLGAGAAAFAIAGVGGFGASPLAFGFALVAVGYAFSRVSGGHFNPAVSIAGALAGRMSWRDAGSYAGAQVAGGLVAGLVLFVLVLGFDGADTGDALGQSGFGDGYSGFAWWSALLLEIVLTALFVHLVLAVTDTRHQHRALAPLVIGLAYAAVVFAGSAATGGSANPARTIGTNVFAGVDPLLGMLVLVVAALIGALIAGTTYPLLFGRDADPVPGSGLRLGGGGGRKKQDPYAGWDQAYYGEQQQWDQQQYSQQQYSQQQYGQAPYGQQQQYGQPQYEQQQYSQQPYQQGYSEQQGHPQQPAPQPGYGEQPPPQPGHPQQGYGDQQAWGRPEQQGWEQPDPRQDPGSEGDRTRGPQH